MTTAQRIRVYIDKYLLEEPFDGADPIAEEALDSVAMEELIDFLEDEYELTFTDDELARTSFCSVTAVGAIIDRRLSDVAALPGEAP